MTQLAGTVWGELETSHLYAIFKGPYVYFGETGQVPPARWRGHLTSKTDFVAKLQKQDPDEFRLKGPILFVGVYIGMADQETQDRQRIARRAIEAELHKRFELDPTPVAPAIRLLSSAPPSPVSHTFKFDKAEVAMSVYHLIATQYRQWLARPNNSDVIIQEVRSELISKCSTN